MTSLANLTRPDLIFTTLPGPDGSTVLKGLADRLAPDLRGVDADELYRKLMEREELGSTGIGSGVAIPHCKLKSLERGVMAVGVTRQGIEFGAVDGEPVRVFFLLVSPDGAPAEHLRVLAAISRWVKDPSHISGILDSADAETIYGLLQSEEE